MVNARSVSAVLAIYCLAAPLLPASCADPEDLDLSNVEEGPKLTEGGNVLAEGLSVNSQEEDDFEVVDGVATPTTNEEPYTLETPAPLDTPVLSPADETEPESPEPEFPFAEKPEADVFEEEEKTPEPEEGDKAAPEGFLKKVKGKVLKGISSLKSKFLKASSADASESNESSFESAEAN